jgi:hypothetical protein
MSAQWNDEILREALASYGQLGEYVRRAIELLAITRASQNGGLWELMQLAQKDPSPEVFAEAKRGVVAFVAKETGFTSFEASSLVDLVLGELDRLQGLPKPTGVPDPPFGEYVEADSPAIKWVYRKHFFEAIARIKPHVLDEILGLAAPLYESFVASIDGFQRRHLVEWGDYGSSNGLPKHCFPLAVRMNCFEGWPPVAQDLGGEISKWIEKYRLTPAEDDPLWAIEAVLYKLEHAAAAIGQLGDWWTPNETTQSMYFDEAVPPAARGWNPQRKRISGERWLRERIQELKTYLEPRKQELERLRNAGVLVKAPDPQWPYRFENLVKYQVLGMQRRSIVEANGNGSEEGLEKEQQRISNAMRLALVGKSTQRNRGARNRPTRRA